MAEGASERPMLLAGLSDFWLLSAWLVVPEGDAVGDAVPMVVLVGPEADELGPLESELARLANPGAWLAVSPRVSA